MELDVYCPDLSIAFEYQGGQHYYSYHKGCRITNQRRRDQEKYDACQENNITLIVVPYWWNNSKSSLAATIQSHRPDILLQLTQTTATTNKFTKTATTTNSVSTATIVTPIQPTMTTSPSLPIPSNPPQYIAERQMVDKNPASLFVQVYTFNAYMDPTNQYVFEKILLIL